ncbi:MAG: FliH/SctL family protein, partial [Desulfovibrio sp.]|nr:FliH/SctL family protein [Desulfovibrio sp.]
GAAYAERQKVLDEAKVEAHELSRRLLHESETVRAQAQDEINKAQAELDQAQALRQEAQDLRDNGHAEGFQAGMDQAGQELKEFRAEMGQALGAVLYALDSQRSAINQSWRDELVLLMQEAVKAGTGWVLDEEHKKILQSLVFEALNLLEDRATVTVRVHPDDEATVSDMFMAARERVPELQQWIVSGDTSVERGGLLAESVSGSVDCRREHYTELVDGIMSYLTLGAGQDDGQSNEAVSQLVRQEAERIAAMAPVPEHLASPDQPDGPYVDGSATADASTEPYADQPDAPGNAGEASVAGSADPLHVAPPFGSSADPSDAPPDQEFQASPELALQEDHELPVPDTQALLVEEPDLPDLAPVNASAPAPGTQGSPEIPSAPTVAAQSPSGHDAVDDAFATAASAHPADQVQTDGLPAEYQPAEYQPAEYQPAEYQPVQDLSAQGLAPQENAAAAAPSASAVAPPAASPESEPAAAPAHVSGSDAAVPPAPAPAQAATRGADAVAPRRAAQIESPTLAELEDELFPLDAEDGHSLPQQASPQTFDPSALADLIDRAERAQHEDLDVFSQGGFLPGADKGR